MDDSLRRSPTERIFDSTEGGWEILVIIVSLILVQNVDTDSRHDTIDCLRSIWVRDNDFQDETHRSRSLIAKISPDFYVAGERPKWVRTCGSNCQWSLHDQPSVLGQKSFISDPRKLKSPSTDGAKLLNARWVSNPNISTKTGPTTTNAIDEYA